MTRSIWDEMVARRDSATNEDVEPVRDPDYERPTYDEWRRDENERREHADERHEVLYSYNRYGY